MVLQLSTVMFTDQADVVPALGMERIVNNGTTNALAGDDIITGVDNEGEIAFYNDGTLTTGDGNDIITGDSTVGQNYGFYNNLSGSIDMGKGNDMITGIGIVGIYNNGNITTGEGNDTITGTHTGEGSEPITNYLSGSIYTGDGNDVIIANSRGIDNEGIINTGNGNDSIISNFVSHDHLGRVFLGNGKDYLKGFGSGNFNGGNGKDTLELTPGSYIVGISETTVNFTGYNYWGISIMETSEFEKLIAGSTTYDFGCLTDGQTIIVA